MNEDETDAEFDENDHVLFTARGAFDRPFTYGDSQESSKPGSAKIGRVEYAEERF